MFIWMIKELISQVPQIYKKKPSQYLTNKLNIEISLEFCQLFVFFYNKTVSMYFWSNKFIVSFELFIFRHLNKCRMPQNWIYLSNDIKIYYSKMQFFILKLISYNTLSIFEKHNQLIYERYLENVLIFSY